MERDTLTLLLTELRSERDAAARHFESLDTKAGIVLGFSGLLVAFPAVDRSVVFGLGQGVAILAAVIALSALLPRRFPLFLGRSMLQAFARVTLEEAAIRLVEGLMRAEEPIARVLRSKARLLLVAGSSLVLAVALIGAGTLIR